MGRSKLLGTRAGIRQFLVLGMEAAVREELLYFAAFPPLLQMILVCSLKLGVAVRDLLDIRDELRPSLVFETGGIVCKG